MTLATNRFYGCPGDVSTQLAPWTLRQHGFSPTKALFTLQAPLRLRSDVARGDITVPVGFVSDLASIPSFAWAIFMAPDDPRIELGAWVHDFLYHGRGVIPGVRTLSRREADRVLAFEAMPELGATRLQQLAVYYALRAFGGACWGT